jgi:phenylalanyl-tRNA synthetase beta chain
MKIPLNWISLYADISQILNKLWAIDLAHIYSISTAEIDDIIYFWKEDKILIWKIIEVKSHPDSNHLNITQVDLWSFWKTQIVCGAANVVNAIYVPVATIWAKLWEDFEIKNTYIRWIESNGMICSEDELWLQEERASWIMQLENYFSKEVLEKNIWKPFFDLKTSIPW